MASFAELHLKTDLDAQLARIIKTLTELACGLSDAVERIERLEQALMDYDSWFQIENKFPKT